MNHEIQGFRCERISERPRQKKKKIEHSENRSGSNYIICMKEIAFSVFQIVFQYTQGYSKLINSR